MSYRLLRFFAVFFNVIGWACVICFTGLGFLPWLLSTIDAVPVPPRWQFLAVYGSPVAGLLIGFLAGLGFFFLAQLIRVFLDQRDLLEQILDTLERLLATQAPADISPTAPAAVTRLETHASDEKTL